MQAKVSTININTAELKEADTHNLTNKWIVAKVDKTLVMVY